MAETPSHQPYIDVKRAGLNPAADYGSSEGRREANKALAEYKAELAQEKIPPEGQMSFFLDNTTVELDPAAIPYKKTELGSAAKTTEQMLEDRQTRQEVAIDSVRRDDGTGRSAGAQRRQANLDAIQSKKTR